MPTHANTTPTPAAPGIPRIEDHPAYVRAAANRNRLAGEVARLEAEASNLRAVAAEQRRQAGEVAKRLV